MYSRFRLLSQPRFSYRKEFHRNPILSDEMKKQSYNVDQLSRVKDLDSLGTAHYKGYNAESALVKRSVYGDLHLSLPSLPGYGDLNLPPVRFNSLYV